MICLKKTRKTPTNPLNFLKVVRETLRKPMAAPVGAVAVATAALVGLPPGKIHTKTEIGRDTPPKFNMEPKNHLFEKETHLPCKPEKNGFHVNFQGCKPFPRDSHPEVDVGWLIYTKSSQDIQTRCFCFLAWFCFFYSPILQIKNIESFCETSNFCGCLAFRKHYFNFALTIAIHYPTLPNYCNLHTYAIDVS